METAHRPMFNCLNPTIGVEILDVVRTLKSKLEVKALYCFGIHSQTTFRKSSIYPENKINATKVHLTMFVLSNNLPSNAIADLGNQVRKETADKYKLTLLIHKPSQIKKANHKNSYLYRQIMKKGWLMQTQQPLHHLINPSESTNRSTQQIKKFAEN